MAIIGKIWNGIRQLIGLILPMFAKATDFHAWEREIRWTLRVLLLALVLIGLYFLSDYLQLDRVLPDFPQSLSRHLWLPTLFLLLVALSWLGWWLWQLLMEQEGSQYPDIDQAWNEAVAAMNKAGINITETPIYMVLGRPKAGEEGLFQAADLNWRVQGEPKREAPLHVYATRDAICVTCVGVSALGRASVIVGASSGVSTFDIQVPDESGGRGGADYGTAVPEGPAAEALVLLRKIYQENREPTEEEQQQLKALERKGHTPGKLTSNLNLTKADIAHCTNRLRHLYRLIIRDRGPYCPVNGFFVLLPLALTESAGNASQTIGLLQHELVLSRDILQVQCPTVVLVCDLETLPGFQEFVTQMERRDKDARKRRLGQRFPLMPDIPDRNKEPEWIETATDWIGQVILPVWVYQLFRLEAPGREAFSEVIRDNGRLFQFLYYFRERQTHLTRVIREGVAARLPPPLLYRGCYLAGTGSRPQEQAFIAGFFRRLTEDRGNFVSWTPEGFQEEERFNRWTKYGYLGTGIFTAVVVIILLWFGFANR